jgi:two-component system sensor kinase FixL
MPTLLHEHHRRGPDAAHHLSALAHMDRRAALGELAASLTHELMQPLAAILRNAEAAKAMLASGQIEAGKLSEIVEDIRTSDKRAGDIVRSVRAMFSHDVPKREPLELDTVVRGAIALVASEAARRDVRLTVTGGGHAILVPGDRTQLEQVLINLLLNGMDATTSCETGRRLVTTAVTLYHGRAQLTVTDRGPGLDEALLDQIFEPFFTTKLDGMGMGLSISRRILEAHGGWIVAGNRPEGGATFTISLPLAGRSDDDDDCT